MRRDRSLDSRWGICRWHRRLGSCSLGGFERSRVAGQKILSANSPVSVVVATLTPHFGISSSVEFCNACSVVSLRITNVWNDCPKATLPKTSKEKAVFIAKIAGLKPERLTVLEVQESKTTRGEKVG